MNDDLLIVYSNLGLGGIPVRIVDIVNRMAETRPGSSITLILKKRPEFDRRKMIQSPGVAIVDYPHMPLIPDNIGFIIWLWLYIYSHNPKTILAFISAYALPVLAAKKLFFWRNMRVVVNEAHYTQTMIGEMTAPSIHYLGIRTFYKSAGAVIVPTSAIKTHLTDTFGIPAELITVIPSWTRFAHRPVPKRPRKNDVIYIGRIEKKKHIPELLAILRKTIIKRPTTVCKIFGKGDDVEAIQSYIHENRLGRHISLLPPVSDVYRQLTDSKVLVFRPDKKAEGFPLAILESMACGTLVVTGSFAGAEDVIVNGKNGFIASSDTEMKRRILDILKRYGSYGNIAKQAKIYVSRRHSADNIDMFIDTVYGKHRG